MAVLIHNKVASPVTLPFPYGAILVGGGSVVVPGTPDSVRANFGDLAQATTILDFRQVDDSQISISPNAVITITGRFGSLARAASSTPNPSMPGMRRSVTTTAGRAIDTAASAASPLSAVRTR